MGGEPEVFALDRRTAGERRRDAMQSGSCGIISLKAGETEAWTWLDGGAQDRGRALRVHGGVHGAQGLHHPPDQGGPSSLLKALLYYE